MSTPLAAPSDLHARLNPNPARWRAPVLAEIGVAVALSLVLSYVAKLLPAMPQGGSFGLEMLPILFVALRCGVVPGIVAGALSGALQLAGLGGTPYIYHPLQALLDYPLAFAALGLGGLVPAPPADPHLGLRVGAAVFVATAGRFVFHFLSGLLFFAEYAPAWETPWLYSVTYNLIYLVPSAIVTAILLWPLLRAYDAAFPGEAG